MSHPKTEAEEVTIAHIGGPDIGTFDEGTVQILMESLAEIGLLHPVVIQLSPDGASPWIVAGRNRLEAARRLGWSSIRAIRLPGTATGDDAETAKLAMIGENLHRRPLDAIESAELTLIWAEAVEARKEAAQLAQLRRPGMGAGAKGGLSAVARDLDISRDALRRARAIAGLSVEAKKAARAYGVDGNQSALLEAAKESEPARQAEILTKRAAKPKRVHGAGDKYIPIQNSYEFHSIVVKALSGFPTGDRDLQLARFVLEYMGGRPQSKTIDHFAALREAWASASPVARNKFKALIGLLSVDPPEPPRVDSLLSERT